MFSEITDSKVDGKFWVTSSQNRNLGNKMNEGDQAKLKPGYIMDDRNLLTRHYFMADYIITME